MKSKKEDTKVPVKELSWYDKLRISQKELAKTLTPVSTNLKAYSSQFGNLKMAVLDRIEMDTLENKLTKEELKDLETFRSGEKFGFKENLVNLLMTYAYEAGKNSNKNSFNARIKEMNDGFEKMKNILDDMGYIDNTEY